ncbi:MAG: FeoA family protein [Spirochaetales bacterium]|uniref:FeoA family protein n=1 Tax=Candidatus Thalassospirochaeta sargassi TaxID=3119039 RepID=A0AAJ1IB96_9SPIO|nr:FeoA family protein [Spirochaetales bacterium]
MSLSELEQGKKAVVASILGGRNLRQRLVNMGMLPGSEVTVVRSSKMGPMVLNVQGAQVMIGRGMAKQIYVKQQ